MHSGDVKAVPHSIQCHRPFKLRHGKSVPVMTEVEGNFCNKNEDKNRSYEFTLNTSHSFFSKSLIAKIVKKIFRSCCIRINRFWLVGLINFFNLSVAVETVDPNLSVIVQLGSTFKRHVAQKPNLMTSTITARENQGKYFDFLLIISTGGKLHR